MIKRFLEWFTSHEEREAFNGLKHKLCKERGGGGLDFIAGPCTDCDGNGFIGKTRKELWNGNFSNTQ